jgi:hypothetical protein
MKRSVASSTGRSEIVMIIGMTTLYLGSNRWRERISPGNITPLLKKTGKIELQVAFSIANS